MRSLSGMSTGALLVVVGLLAPIAAQDPYTDAADRAYNVNGSSYMRPQWFYNYSSASGVWFTHPYTVFLDTSSSNNAELDTANQVLKLTDAASGAVQNGVQVIAQTIVPEGTGDNIRFRMDLKFGSTRADADAGAGMGVYYMKQSEYNSLTHNSQAGNWQSRCEGGFPTLGFGAAMRTGKDSGGAVLNGFSTRVSTLGQPSKYKYEQKPTLALRQQSATPASRVFEAKFNHSRITIKWDGNEQFIGSGTPTITQGDMMQTGTFNTTNGDPWVFLVGASTSSGYLDTQIIDNLEISYWTLKRVPQPPEFATFISSTSSTVTFSWTPHPDDGGAPVMWYNINATSFNATCQDSNSVAQTYGCAYDVKTRCNLTVSEFGQSTSAPCTIGGLRRATEYYIEMAGNNVVGQGPWQRALGYKRLKVYVQTGIPAAPTGIKVIARGVDWADLIWNATTEDGGAPVTNYQVKINQYQGPYIAGAMNLAPPAVSPQFTNSTVLQFRVTGLFRLSNYTFQVSCSNEFTRNGIQYGFFGNYSAPTARITTLPTVPTAPSFSGTPITTGWDVVEVPPPPKFCWIPCRQKLYWTTPSDDGGYPITSYLIYPTSLPNVQWTDTSHHSTFSSLVSSNSLVIDGLLRSTQYSWRVRASTSVGVGPASGSASMTTLNMPDMRDLALGMPTSQISDWFPNQGHSTAATDGNTNGNAMLGAVAVTSTSPFPWWKVELGQERWITKVRAYSCQSFPDPAIPAPGWGCFLKYYHLRLRTNGTTQVSFRVDGVDESGGTVNVREFIPNPSRVSLGQYAGNKGDEVLIKSQIPMGFLAIAEVRVFGWDVGCDEEYVCLNGGTCEVRRNGMDYRKCNCLPGFGSHNCVRLSNTWGSGGSSATSTDRESGSAGQYLAFAIMAAGIMGGVWFLCLGSMFLWWKFLGDGAHQGPTAKVMPYMETNSLASQYNARSAAVENYRSKLGLGGSAAAQQARAKAKARGYDSKRSRKVSRAKPEVWMPEMETSSAVENVSIFGADDIDGVTRGPPCGLPLGFWRLMKDRGKFVIVLGFALGVGFFLLMVLGYVLG